MKKFFSILIALVACSALFSAQAVNVTFHVTQTGAARLQWYTYEEGSYTSVQHDQVLDQETTTIEGLSSGGMVYIYNISDDYSLTKITVNSGSAYTNIGSTYNYIYITGEDDLDIDLTIKSASEIYGATLYLTVDDPDAVVTQFGGTYRTVSVDEADVEKAIPFDPDRESTFTFSTTTYGKSVYKATLNGENLTIVQYNSVDIKDGDHLVITSKYPEGNVHVTLTYGEGAEGFVTKVLIDEEEISDFANGFDAPIGSVVSIYGDTQNYKYESMSINGTPISYFYSYTSFTAIEDTEVNIQAHQYGTITVTVNIDDPSRMDVYKGYSFNGELLECQAGDNTVELSENNAVMTFALKDANAYYFSSITVGEDEKYLSSSVCVYDLADGDVITVKSAAYDRDKTAILFIDDLNPESAGSYTSFSFRSTLSNYAPTVEAGYNEVPFCDGDNPFGISAYGYSFNNVYLNEEVLDPYYPGGTYFKPEFADGDVLKVYLSKDPAKYTVTFDVDATVQDLKVVKDIITEVNTANELSVLEDTQFNIIGENIQVRVNEDSLQGEDGVYTFTLTGNTTVKIGSETGVENLLKDATINGAIYNLQGIKVLDNASDLNQLPAGMYISNGKKYINK